MNKELYIMLNLKANHNKDYSVVKTFRAAPFRVSFSFFLKKIAKSLDIFSNWCIFVQQFFCAAFFCV